MDKAVLITIGDEILSGNTVDTNSNFIASELKNYRNKTLYRSSRSLTKLKPLKIL